MEKLRENNRGAGDTKMDESESAEDVARFSRTGEVTIVRFGRRYIVRQKVRGTIVEIDR